MKLLIITPYFYPKIGGVEKYIYELTKHLLIYDLDIIIVSYKWDKYDNLKNIENIKQYKLTSMFKISTTPVDLFIYQNLLKIVNDEKPDIINSHTPVPLVSDVASRIANDKKIPFILNYHNDLVGNGVYYILSKLYYNFLGYKTMDLSNVIIVTSEYYAGLSPYLKNYKNKIRVISPGVNLNLFNTNNINKLNNKKTVLFVGQLNKGSRHKGLIYLMDSIKLLSSLNIQLFVIGSGDFKDIYQKYAEEINIEEKVNFLGHVSEIDLANYYKMSDLVVLPSYNKAEGFGMVLIEAQACGVPVIGTTVGGIPYSMINNETGYLVPPKNSKLLAEKIHFLINHTEKSIVMGNKGHEFVSNKFTWEKSAKEFYKILCDFT
jgi:glycosyltransferase involved in cell wall biosynthesis